MALNPDNVKIWQDAHVWLSAEVTRPVLPTDINTAFGVGWEEAGILNGDDGFAEDRSQDESKHYGWGIGLVKIGSKNYELMRKFSPLEDNTTIRQLVWPGSTATKRPMPKPVYRWIAFETDSDLGDRERLIGTMRARLWVPANARNESDPTKWEIDVALFSDGTGNVFDVQAGTPT